MGTRRTRWLPLLAIGVAACTGQGPLPTVYGADPINVSLVQLIATPRDFHGKLVRVRGFCHLEFEGNALYLHRDDPEWGILRNAVWLALDWPPVPDDQKTLRAQLSDRYVLVEGVFDAKSGDFSGSLGDIQRIEPIPSREELRRPGSRQ